jgi:ribonuclease HII
MRVAGVDDAGRGPVIGPLVVAGVLIEESRIQDLISIGVKDSKLLSPSARKRLSERIKQAVDKYEYVELTPAQIDEFVLKGKKLQRLNFLEAKAMAEIISRLKPDIAYVDASDVMADRFGKQVMEALQFKVKVISEHHADEKYPVVSAASILAKTFRDDIIDKLRGEYGDFGSGYPADPKVVNFLKEWLKKYGSYPPIVRKSWRTLEKINKSLKQAKFEI